jgi:hypothetical protein
MNRFLVTILMCLAVTAAQSQDSPVGNETPAAEQAPDKAISKTTADAADKDKTFTPPPGFQTKKRGELLLYCKRDRETGTRFTTEKCYDEDQVREYILAMEVQKRDLDRIRSTCATASTCAPQ